MAHLENETFFIRCNSKNCELLDASLEREWICTNFTSAAGISPRPIDYYPDQGVMVFEYIQTDGRVVNLRDPKVLGEFCDLIRSMHNLSIQFPYDFCPYASIEFYLSNAAKEGAYIPQVVFDKILPGIEHLKTIYPLSTEKVPCHLDLHHGNLLDSGEKLWLIDFEYAGMSDPLFDLAVLASTDNFSDQEMIFLLKTYYNTPTLSAEKITHFKYLRLIADLRWSIWYYLQAKISPIDAPYSFYAEHLLKRVLNTLSTLPGWTHPELGAGN
jgi:hypothetical protein